MKPKSFILYNDQWDAIRLLTYEQAGHLLFAIFRMMNGEDAQTVEKSLPESVLFGFRLIMLQLRLDAEKYQQTCEKNRQNIMKRWSKKEKDTTVDLVIPNKDKDKDKDKDYDKDKDKDWEEVGRINSSSSSSTVSDAANGNEEEDEEDNFSIMIKEKFLPWWNQLVKDYDSNIKPLRIMTEKRIERLRQICDTYGKDILFEACRKAISSPFLNGRNAKNRFVATFDWIIDEKNFLNVLEGNFYTK